MGERLKEGVFSYGPGWSHTFCLVQAGLMIRTVLLPQSPVCWDHRCVQSHPAKWSTVLIESVCPHCEDQQQHSIHGSLQAPPLPDAILHSHVSLTETEIGLTDSPKPSPLHWKLQARTARRFMLDSNSAIHVKSLCSQATLILGKCTLSELLRIPWILIPWIHIGPLRKRIVWSPSSWSRGNHSCVHPCSAIDDRGTTLSEWCSGRHPH